MDGFTAGVMFFCMCMAGAFVVGHWLPQTELLDDCNKRNEMVIRNTIFTCKPVGILVDGKRLEIK